MGEKWKILAVPRGKNIIFWANIHPLNKIPTINIAHTPYCPVDLTEGESVYCFCSVEPGWTGHPYKLGEYWGKMSSIGFF